MNRCYACDVRIIPGSFWCIDCQARLDRALWVCNGTNINRDTVQMILRQRTIDALKEMCGVRR